MSGTDRSEQLTGTAGAGDTVSLAPPGPGMWEMETVHHGRRPLSGFLAETYRRAHEEGTAEVVTPSGEISAAG